MGSLDAGSPEFAPYVAQLLNLDDSWRVSDRAVGNGQVAQCRRFEFVRGDDTVSVISKSPSADQTSRDTARLQHLYRRETSFYRELRPLIATRTPLPLHVEHHDDDSFLLLLEDLTPSTAVDQFSGLTVEQTAAALHELAGLHGPTAQRADLFAWPWLGGVATDLQPLYDAVLPGLFNQFLERYAEMIDNETRRTVRSLRDQLGGLSSFEPSLRTVVHGDYRSENLIIDGRNGDVPLAVVDWQTVSVSSPMLDVAYLITTSLTTEDRVTYEAELIDLYLNELREYDVELSLDDARHAFARYTLQPIVMLVAASVIVERTDRGDAMFLTMIRRAVDAVTDWNALRELA